MTLPAASKNGLTLAIDVTNRFGSDLLDEAGRIAERYGAQAASPEHVRMAAEYLYRTGNRENQVLTSVGGLFAGIGGSATFSFLVASSINAVAVGGSVAF